MKQRTTGPLLGAVALAVAGMVLSGSGTTQVHAADHQESPLTAADPAADIGDLYAWHTADSLVIALTYAGYAMPNAEPTYDANVLYTLHISTDGDATSEHQIDVRFGQNGAGEWGVSARNVPGESEAVEGPVDMSLTGMGGAQVYAGLRDDPFFFDLQGFQDTLMSGDVSFDSTRDFALLQNTNAIVVELPLAALGTDTTALRIWATTGRK